MNVVERMKKTIVIRKNQAAHAELKMIPVQKDLI
jgi:hypothetical protein